MTIDDKFVHEALQRFARSPDGVCFYLALQKVLMSVPTSLEAGALQENVGRRRFASELMAVMAKGMSETPTSDDPRGRPVIYKLPEPVALGGARGVRRRVSDHDPGNDG